MIVENITALIGRTPLVRLSKIAPGIRLFGKPEFLNPGGSAKDRVAQAMLDRAEATGQLVPGATVIEATSGNTGIALAMVCAARSYGCIIVMPDSMSRERQLLMKAFGADLVLTPGALGMTGAIARAEELNREIPGSIIAGQFENPANPDAHYRTTGPEIWEDTDGNVDIFVAGIGTGGTISGVGAYLKECRPNVRVVGVEPADSPLLTQGRSGPHGLQGIGANFVPKALNRDILDDIRTVTTEQAYAAARRLGVEEGILCGISGGAALHIALELAASPENAGKTVVALLPDSGDRYLSTELYL